MSKEDIFKGAAEDASYTHSNEVVITANGLYCYMIAQIINGTPLQETYDEICKEIEETKSEDLIAWLQDSQKTETPEVKKKAGWARHAMVLCLRFLKRATTIPELSEPVSGDISEGDNPKTKFYSE